MGYHYVPQEYLRGFTHPTFPNALWQFDKKKMVFSNKTASIKRIAQQRFFYDEETEQLLNKHIEIPGNRVIKKLRSCKFNLTDEERIDLSVYIANMLKRVPHYRKKIRINSSSGA